MSGLFTNRYRPVVNILGGIRVQTSVFGLPRPIVYGTTRISPNMLWYGDFFWKPATGNKKGYTGGGGTGKKAGGEYDYGAAVIIGLCQGKIDHIGTVWNSSGNLPIQETSETFTVTPGGSYTATNAPTYLADDGVTKAVTYSVTANDYGSPGSIILTGTQQTPQVDGTDYHRSGVNGATYTFVAGGTYTITYSYSPPDTSGGVPQDPIQSVNFTLFKGTQGQLPWSYLTSKHPSQAIGYTEMAYLATPVLDLGMSGVLPSFNFEVFGNLTFRFKGQKDCDPSVVLYDLLTNPLYGCGLVAGEIDSLTQYSNYCVANGLFISPAIDTERTAKDWIQDFLKATNSEIIESGGLLKIVPYGDTTVVANGVTFSPTTGNSTTPNAPVYDLSPDDLIRDGMTPPVEITRPSVQDAYNSEKVEFLDRGNSYNTAVVEAQDLNAINLYKYRPAPPQQFHFFTSQTAAAKCASTLLARDVYIRNQYKFKTTQKFILVDPMDLVTLPAISLGMDPSAPNVPVRILTINENDKRELEFTAEEFPWGTCGPTLYPKQAALGAEIQLYAPPGPINAPIMFEALSRLNDQIGHTVWFGLSGANPNWGGCRIYVSLDGVSYKQVGVAIGRTKMGYLTADLPFNSDPDTSDTLSVDISESLETLDGYTSQQTNTYFPLCFVGYPSSAAGATYVLQDGLGGLWLVGLTNGGIFTTVPVLSGSPSTIYISDLSGTNSFLLGVDTIGRLTTTQVTFNPSYPTAVSMNQLDGSPSGWTAGVTLGGLLQSSPFAFSAGELIAYETATLTAPFKYNLGTLLRRGVYNSVINDHPIGCNFMFLNDQVEGWDYDVKLIGSTVYFKFPSFNQSGLVQENLSDVPAYPFTITGAAVGLLSPAHASYRPLTNPLTAVDAGSSATIDVAAFSMRVPGQADIPFGSGSITGLSYHTLYYVYFADYGFEAIPAPTYLASLTKEDAIDQAGYFFVGSILTPYSGGQPTTGNNDGGGGAQIGMLNVLEMANPTIDLVAGNGSVTNPDLAVDGDETTAAVLIVTGNSGNNSARLKVSAAAGLKQAFSAQKMRALVEVTQNNPVGIGVTATVFFSYGTVTVSPAVFPGGTIPAGTLVPKQWLEVDIPVGTNPTQLYFTADAELTTGATSGGVTVKVYEVQVQAIT